ncbi:unnamed protein product [Schistosoma bovis]|nr:unnamed protein product [Schistosoma bovis]
MASFTTNTSLPSNQIKMFPDNIVNLNFPSFLPYSSTFALFNELKTKLKHNSHIIQNNNLQSTEINHSLSQEVYKDNISLCSNSMINNSSNCHIDFDDTQTINPNNDHHHHHHNSNNESKDPNDNIEEFSLKLENFGNIFKNSFIPPYYSIQKNNHLTYQHNSLLLKNNQYPLHINNNRQSNHYHSRSMLDNSSIKLETGNINDSIVTKKDNTNTQILYHNNDISNERIINDHENTIKLKMKSSISTTMIEDKITNKELINKSINQLCLSNPKNHKFIEFNKTMNNSHNDDINEQLKRYRTSYTQKQIELLEKTYQLDRYINRPQRAKLSVELDLPENKIKVWFQNRRMKEKRQALMLPTVAGKDPYLRETLLKVTQLYCATRYGNESPNVDITKFQSKVSQNRNVSNELRKRIRTSLNSTTITSVLSNKNNQNNCKSNKPWVKESNTITNQHNVIHKENEVNQSNIYLSKSMLNITNEQVISKKPKNEVVTLDSSYETTNSKYQNHTQFSTDSITDKNCDMNKWTIISHPLNLSTSSVSSDENHSLIEDQFIQTKQNKPNLFSTFPFIHNTSSAMLDDHNESVISSTISQMNSF